MPVKQSFHHTRITSWVVLCAIIIAGFGTGAEFLASIPPAAAQVVGSPDVKERDSKRISDLKQIQTALEIYYTGNNKYPIASTAVILGSGGYACLNASGWAAVGCPSPYFATVPNDPVDSRNYQYTSVDGVSYVITAVLEGEISGLSGNIAATPAGISTATATVATITNVKVRDSKRIADVKKIQAALELYYASNNKYPVVANNVTLGSDNYACLNANGWSSSGCANPFLPVFPKDPVATQNYQYLSLSNGIDYGIIASLEGLVGGLSGQLIASRGILKAASPAATVRVTGDEVPAAESYQEPNEEEEECSVVEFPENYIKFFLRDSQYSMIKIWGVREKDIKVCGTEFGARLTFTYKTPAKFSRYKIRYTVKDFGVDISDLGSSFFGANEPAPAQAAAAVKAVESDPAVREFIQKNPIRTAELSGHVVLLSNSKQCNNCGRWLAYNYLEKRVNAYGLSAQSGYARFPEVNEIMKVMTKEGIVKACGNRKPFGLIRWQTYNIWRLQPTLRKEKKCPTEVQVFRDGAGVYRIDYQQFEGQKEPPKLYRAEHCDLVPNPADYAAVVFPQYADLSGFEVMTKGVKPCFVDMGAWVFARYKTPRSFSRLGIPYEISHSMYVSADKKTVQPDSNWTFPDKVKDVIAQAENNELFKRELKYRFVDTAEIYKSYINICTWDDRTEQRSCFTFGIGANFGKGEILPYFNYFWPETIAQPGQSVPTPLLEGQPWTGPRYVLNPTAPIKSGADISPVPVATPEPIGLPTPPATTTAPTPITTSTGSDVSVTSTAAPVPVNLDYDWKISNIRVTDVTAASAKITWTTNVPLTSQVVYGQPQLHKDVQRDEKLVTEHAMILKDLLPKTIYSVTVWSTGDLGRAISAESPITFTTLPPADQAPPVITNINVTNIATNEATATWTTDEPSTSLVDYGFSGRRPWRARQDISYMFVTDHKVRLPGLIPSTTYSYYIVSKDAAGNKAEVLSLSFTTPPWVPGQ